MSSQSRQAQLLEAASMLRRQHLEQSDYCDECGTETDIANLNIITGLCSACTKFDVKKMRELFEKGMKFIEGDKNV